MNNIRGRAKEYEHFLHFEPVAMAGYSIYIYHITLDDANRVRRELGLPELGEDWERGQERGADGRLSQKPAVQVLTWRCNRSRQGGFGGKALWTMSGRRN